MAWAFIPIWAFVLFKFTVFLFCFVLIKPLCHAFLHRSSQWKSCSIDLTLKRWWRSLKSYEPMVKKGRQKDSRYNIRALHSSQSLTPCSSVCWRIKPLHQNDKKGHVGLTNSLAFVLFCPRRSWTPYRSSATSPRPPAPTWCCSWSTLSRSWPSSPRAMPRCCHGCRKPKPWPASSRWAPSAMRLSGNNKTSYRCDWEARSGCLTSRTSFFFFLPFSNLSILPLLLSTMTPFHVPKFTLPLHSLWKHTLIVPGLNKRQKKIFIHLTDVLHSQDHRANGLQTHFCSHYAWEYGEFSHCVNE